MTMSDLLSLKPPGRVRGRPFEKGRSGNPGGRRRGSRNKTTLAAATLLAGEAEALTRKAVEMALAGDPTAMRLCMERVLPPCRERTIKFSLPPIEGALTGESNGPSAHDVSRAMDAVTSALARGRDHTGRGGDDRAGCRNLRAGNRNNQEGRLWSQSAGDFGGRGF
jgi:hypothetical protein